VEAIPESEPPSDLELTFGTEPIVGTRIWNITWFRYRDGRTEPRLTSYSAGHIWSPRQRQVAFCTRGHAHESPWPDCECGLWAMRKHGPLPVSGSVIGEVYLWGRVIEFEDGYRAQYAYPKSLRIQAAHVHNDEKVVTELYRLYGVSVSYPEPE
jgi:hypothetical protein